MADCMFQPTSKLPQVGTTLFSVITRRANELGALNLAQGFPDFAPPAQLSAALNEVLAQSAHQSVHQYAPGVGSDALRERIAGLCASQLDIALHDLDDITVTLGATEGLFSTVLALVHAGDEVILLDPCYDSYGVAVALCGAQAVHVPLLLPDFAVDWQRVRDAVTPRTRMIIVNSPHNPTGAVWSADDVEQLASLVRDTGIVVLSDEVYANMVFDGRCHHSLQAHAELRERSVSVFSFGKALHATGWRVGYTVAPAALTREIRRVHQFNTFSIAHPLQAAIARFLDVVPDHVAGLAAFYQAKRDEFLKLVSPSRFRFIPAAGSFFQLLDYSSLSDAGDEAYAEQLLTRAGVATIPLSPFYAQPPALRLLRFCFAKRSDTLQQAAARLNEL